MCRMTEQNIAMKFSGGISRKQRNLLQHGGLTPEEVGFVEDKTRAGKSEAYFRYVNWAYVMPEIGG